MNGLSFLFPAGFAVLALTPLLFLAYLNRTPLRKKIVSSLILIRELPKTPAIRDRIRLPWRFFLEALIFLLLAGIAAYPKYSNRGARVAVLLDNSLSMNTLERSGVKRFETAKRELENWLGLQSGKDRFTLYTTSPKLKKSSADLIDGAGVVSAVDGVLLSSAPDLLDGALSQLVASGEYQKVFVISDKQAHFSATAAKETFPVDTRTVGENVANVALLNLRLERQNGKTIVAAMTAYGERVVQAKLRATSGGRVIGESSVELEPKRMVEARLALNRDSNEIVRVELLPQEPSLDALPLDDVGYIDLGRTSATNLLVVSDLTPDESVFGLRSFGAEHVSGTRYTTLSEETLDGYRGIIFHGLIPRELPRVPALVISPPLANVIFPGKGEFSEPRISSWNMENQLTSYMNFGLLRIPHSLVFEPPAWTQSVVNVEQGPVVIAGEENGVRRVAVGFELLPFEGRKTPTLSVFTLNILSWFSGGAQFEETLRTGALLPVPRSGSWEVIFPGGRVVKNDEEQDLRADLAGLYRVRSGAEDRRIVVNAFHPDESTTNEQGQFEATIPVENIEETEGESSLWRDLLQLALVLVALDIVIRGVLLFRVRHA